jgi:hypothetical protein
MWKKEERRSLSKVQVASFLFRRGAGVAAASNPRQSCADARRLVVVIALRDAGEALLQKPHLSPFHFHPSSSSRHPRATTDIRHSINTSHINTSTSSTTSKTASKSIKMPPKGAQKVQPTHFTHLQLQSAFNL